MAWVDELLFQIRSLITEDWKIEDDERMGEVCSLFVQARLDHARDCGEAPYSEVLKAGFSDEFAQLLREARAFESADLLRDQVTSALFTLPVVSLDGAGNQQTAKGHGTGQNTGTLPLHLN